MNNKVKVFTSLAIGILMLSGLFAFAAPASAASNVTCNSATIGAWVDPQGVPTTAWMQWGKSSSLSGETFSSTPETYYTYETINVDITGLAQNTTYYYRARFHNSSRGYWDGSIKSFTTLNCEPQTTAPTVNLTADNYTISYGSSTTLRWTTTNNPTSCVAEGAWSGNKNINGGSQSTGSLTSAKTYHITCSNSAGSDSDLLTINVEFPPMQNPSVNLTANPISIQAGQSSTLHWDSNNANSCSANWTTSTNITGDKTVSPSQTTTYNITCYGASGTTPANDSVKVTVTEQTLDSNLHLKSVLKSSCGASGGTEFSGVKIPVRNPNNKLVYNGATYSGSSFPVWVVGNYSAETPSGYNSNYQFCGYSGSPAYFSTTNQSEKTITANFANVAVTPAPSVDLTADNYTVNYGSSTTLRWTTTNNPTSCTASGDWSGSKNLNSGNQSTNALYSTKTYSITCSNSAGSDTDQVTIMVGNPEQQVCQNPNAINYGGPLPCQFAQQPAPSVDLTADNYTVNYGSSTTLRWTTTNNPTSCTASGDWSGSKNLNSGNQSTNALYSTKTYSITCSNSAGSDSDSVTVSVGGQQNYPTVNLTADDYSISYGDSTILRWDSDNADYCQASGGWSGFKNLTGSQSTSSLNSTKTYIITCYSNTGQAADSVIINVDDEEDNERPDVTTRSATSIDRDEATLRGEVDGNGLSTRVWFEWSDDRDEVEDGDGEETDEIYTGSGTDDFDEQIDNLDEDTTYYFRAVARNSEGTDYGSILSFRTDEDDDNNDDDDAPDVSTRNATSVGTSNATLNGRVDGNGRSTRAWFEYGTTYGLGYSTSEKSYGSGSTSYNRSISGLSPNTTYYFRAVAENSIDTDYGDIYSFRTTGNYIPPIVNNQPTVGIAADSTNLPYNGATTIRWYTTNATSCSASGGSIGWAGTKNIGPGAFYTASLTSAKTYTLTCYNNYGSASDSVTVNVRGQVTPGPTPTSLVLITSSIDRNRPILPTIDNTNPRPGDEINYTITYQNIGTGSITGLNLRVDLPYEVDYMFSNPNNPTRSGNTLIFNLGTLRANGTGTVTIRVRVRESAAPGAYLNFPAILSYVDPAGQPQSVSANISAQVWRESSSDEDQANRLTANVFGANFLPDNLFGWLLLFVLILILILLARYLFSGEQPFSKKNTVAHH